MFKDNHTVMKDCNYTILVLPTIAADKILPRSLTLMPYLKKYIV